jgi:hypothetical protein
VAFHVGLLTVLTIALRTGIRRSTPVDFTATVISLPSLTPHAVNRPPPPILNESAPISPLEPPAIALPWDSVPSGADASVDWDSEARRAAGAVTGAPRVREFGRIPEAPSWLGSTAPSRSHEAGEQYRLDTGERIVWVSDRCYIVSGLPPLGMPDALARSIPTTTVCKSDFGPRSDLFKDLPAYKKYHPQ